MGTERESREERERVVLELAMGLDIGGAETHIVSLSRSLKEMGWEVLVASGGGRRVRDIAESGIQHFHVPLGLEIRSNASAWNSFISSRQGIDLLHAHARPCLIGTTCQGGCRSPRTHITDLYRVSSHHLRSSKTIAERGG